MENSIIKTDDKYFYENSEVFITRKTDYSVEVKNFSGQISLAEFLSAPRTPSLRKKFSQDSRIENDMESLNSCYSIDRNDKEKAIIHPEKKIDNKHRIEKLVNKNTIKIPLREKNSRQASLSAERRRPFK